MGFNSDLGARLSEGPALTSAIYRAYAQSDRAMEAQSNIGSRSETVADGLRAASTAAG